MIRKTQIDPKTFRKHSSIVAKQVDPVQIVGDRVQTDYGFKVEGYTGKYETFTMVLLKSGQTPLWLHTKKTRVLKVIAGTGTYREVHEDSNIVDRQISAGDEIQVLPGISYKLMGSQTLLEIYVTQESKYESGLVEVAPTEVVASVTPEDLVSVSSADKYATVQTGSRTRRSNKAREQLASLRGQPTREKKSGQDEDSFFRNAATAGVNVKPVMDFDPDGAG